MPGSPNPFQISANLKIDVKEAGTTQLRIYSDSGREVYKATHTSLGPDSFIFSWPDNDRGTHLPSGIYFYTAEFNGFRSVGRLIKTSSDQ